MYWQQSVQKSKRVSLKLHTPTTLTACMLVWNSLHWSVYRLDQVHYDTRCYCTYSINTQTTKNVSSTFSSPGGRVRQSGESCSVSRLCFSICGGQQWPVINTKTLTDLLKLSEHREWGHLPPSLSEASVETKDKKKLPVIWEMFNVDTSITTVYIFNFYMLIQLNLNF